MFLQELGTLYFSEREVADMEFPNEILNLIVSQGLDSCKTSISWSQISPFFRELVTDQLGVIVLQDGSGALHDMRSPLDYMLLMDKKNTYTVLTDHPDHPSILRFVVTYLNLLVVIQTDRSYSDVLTNIIDEIAQHCSPKTNLCVVYSTSLNFLSKLYFRELSLYRKKIRLCELHVIGNGLVNRDEMCDIDTLFERTYLYNLRSIYSLEVQNTAHELISQDLSIVKQLNFLDFNENSSKFLTQCPKLRVIESTKFPIGHEERPIMLPKCDCITLTHYVDGSNYQTIDGTHIYEELTLVPALRSADPEFHDLLFPNIKKLSLKLNEVGSHLVRFYDCDFSNLSTFHCGCCIIPWSDLASASANIQYIIVTLMSLEQLRWLTSCPHVIKNLYIEAPKVKLTDFPISSLFEKTHLKFQTVAIDIQLLWHCYLLKNLILPNVDHGSSLKLVINESALMDAIKLNTIPLEKWRLMLEDNCIIFRIPYIKHFTLIGIGCNTHRMTGAAMINTDSQTSSQIPSPIDCANQYFDMGASPNITYAVSPSEFRRNSLAGADSQTARRQSAIAFSSYYNERRKSSANNTKFTPIYPAAPLSEDPFEEENVVFIFEESCPDILTTNITALETSFFSWTEVKTDRIPLLQIVIQEFSLLNEFDDVAYLVPGLSAQIIEVLNYPFHSRLMNMIIEKLQVVVDFSAADIDVCHEKQSKLSNDLHAYLTYRGHHLRVVTSSEGTDSLLSVLLQFKAH